MLPAVFAARGPHGISTLAIVASGTGVAFLGLLKFEAIVEILNLLCESRHSGQGTGVLRMGGNLGSDSRCKYLLPHAGMPIDRTPCSRVLMYRSALDSARTMR